MKRPLPQGAFLLYVLRLLLHLPSFVRLFWRLFWDSRVPLHLKTMVLAVLCYVLLPFDILPDYLPVVGQIDDLMLLVLAGYYFIRWSPQGVVDEHVAAIDARWWRR